MAIPASSGYIQYDGNLIHPMVSLDLIRKFYCDSIFGEISTTEYSGDIQGCGSQITFWKEPEIEIHNYHKNEPMKPDVIEPCPITMTIDYAKYFNVKVDRIDEHQICNWESYVSAFLERASYNMRQAIDQELLGTMYVDVSPANRGANAGHISGAYDIGEAGAPIAITSDNIIEMFSKCDAVLNEQCIPESDRFIVLPVVAKVTLLNSPLKSALEMGGCIDCSPSITGRIPNSIMGFDVYISVNVPMIQDTGTAYHCLFGHKSATAFAAQLDEADIMKMEASFGKYYRGLMVYGFQVIRDEALGDLYATFA